MNWTSFRYIVFLAMMQMAQATKDACKGTAAAVDVLASAQEMILLIAAFIVGWHLIGPCLGKLLKLFRHETTSHPAGPGSGNSRAAPERKRNGAKSEGCEGTQQSSASVVIGKCDCEGDGTVQATSGALKPCAQALNMNAVWRGECQAPEGPLAANQLLALARQLLKKRDIRGAEKCLQKFGQLTDAPVDVRTRKLFIVACAQSGNMDMGSQYFQQLQSEGLDEDFAIYSAMIRGFCNVGKVEEALSYLESMLQCKLHPDAMLFDVLLEGCVSRNLFQKAERILNLMKDLEIQFSNVTLAACIKLYSSRGEIHRAYAIFEDWVQSNRLQPNSYVYGALISAALRNGRPEMALSIHDASDCTPSSRTYEQLVQCCLHLGLLDRAVQLLDEALGLNDTPRRSFIDPKVIEELLVLISRRKESEKLAMPLLKRLESADFELPENFERFVKPAKTSPLRSKRRADFDCWRSFLR